MFLLEGGIIWSKDMVLEKRIKAVECGYRGKWREVGLHRGYGKSKKKKTYKKTTTNRHH